MSTRKVLLEKSGTLAEAKGKDGVYPIRIITEGKGSSGTYKAQLLERYKDAFSGRPMFMNHPVDPNKPHLRDILTAAATISPQVEYKVGPDGKGELWSEATVRKEYRDFVEQFKSVIGVSIFIEGDGHEEGGEWIVDSFNIDDPYRSVDFVVAAGRGGTVGERAIEAYRAIESSIGSPDGPGSANAKANEREKEKKPMDEQKLIEAFIKAMTEALAPIVKKVEDQSALLESANASKTDKVDAIKVADDVVDALAESKLPKGARARVIEAVVNGKDAKEAVASEKKELEEAFEEYGKITGKARVSESKVVEEDFTVGDWN